MTKLTPKQIVEINYLLKEHLIKGANDIYIYRVGMNDQKVADQVGVTYWHVHNMRKQVYGNAAPSIAKPEPKPRWTVNVTPRLANLEMRLARIEKFMSDDWGYEMPEEEDE